MKVVDEDNTKMIDTLETDLKYLKNMYISIQNLANRQLKNSNDLMTDKETNTELEINNSYVWVKDGIVSKCTSCNKDFSMFNRKQYIIII